MSSGYVIHQTLHGYSNGHKLIVSSIELNNKIKNTLLNESDSPGQEFHQGDNVCYSGYPLIDANYYVFSKTWVATEIERPGCVWTHSLLVPFSLLAHKDILKHFNPYDNFMVRKDIFSLKDNLEPIQFNSDIMATRKNPDLSRFFSYIFSTEQQVKINSNQISAFDIIAMWGKLWPKLRRNFSFKTWSPKKSSDSPYFQKYDLLLTKNVSENILTDNWAETIFSNHTSAITHFMWRHGASLNTERKNVYFLSLCWHLLDEIKFDELSVFILQWKKAPISLIKEISQQLTPENISKSVAYLISTYILTMNSKDISKENLNKIGEILFKIDPIFFNKILKSYTEHARNMSINRIEDIPIEIVTDLYNRGTYYDNDVCKPKIVSTSYFWKKCQNTKTFLKKTIKNKELGKLIPIHEFSPYDLMLSDIAKQDIIMVLLYNFDYLNDEWLEYIIDNQDVFFIDQDLLNKNNKSLWSFIFSNLRMNTLHSLSDEVLSYIYANSTKNNTIILKAALLITDDLRKEYSSLICASFDEICYLTSGEGLNNDEINHLKYNLKRKINSYTYRFSLSYSYYSLRKMYIIFSALFAVKNDLPIHKLSIYGSNLYELDKILNKLSS